MTDRDKIIEVMARGVFENFRVEEVGPAVVSWDAHGCHVPAHDAYLDAARAALTALQAEGMTVVPRERMVDFFAEIDAAIGSVQGALRHYKQPQDVHFHLALKACRDGTAMLAAHTQEKDA